MFLSETRHIKTFDMIEIQLYTLTHNVSYGYEHVYCGQIIMFITKHYSSDTHIMTVLQVRYNTDNTVSTFGGDPVTQLIFNVYQMIKL